MTIIRGETVHETALLSPGGELICGSQEGFEDLIEEECRKSFEKGQKKGEQLGYERAGEDLKLHAHLLQTIATKLFEKKAALLEEIKPELIELIIAICEQVIRDELRHKEVFSKHIQALLRRVLPSLEEETLKVVLAPDDLELIGDVLGDIQVVSDAMIQRGDCRIENRMGLLNHDIVRLLNDIQTQVHGGQVIGS